MVSAAVLLMPLPLYPQREPKVAALQLPATFFCPYSGLKKSLTPVITHTLIKATYQVETTPFMKTRANHDKKVI
jgi:hypothetical protein